MPDFVNQPRLILATASRYKRELFERLSLPFEVDSADIDESPQPGESPEQSARRLALVKAQHVARRHPGAYVIGADQVIALDDEIVSKPRTARAARQQLARQAGRSHDLFTAVALVTPQGAITEALVHYIMEMRPLSEKQIKAYVDEDCPLDCAGSYKIEARGIRLFRSMVGEDYTAIIGLPLTRVWSLLEDAGYFSASNGGNR